MPNHIWSQMEIQERLDNLYQHRPQSVSDRIMHTIMYTLYKAFNWVTGFKPVNTPVKAVEWKHYWKLPEDAMWVDTLKCMFADECNHRDVNHTFATMGSDDPNPFL